MSSAPYHEMSQHVCISLISPANHIFPDSTGFPKNHGVQVGIQMILGDQTGNPPIRSGPIPLGLKSVNE